MSVETMLIVAATALLVFLLPSPSGRSLRDHAHARGKLRATLLLPSIWIGYLAAAFCAGAIYLLIRVTVPAMIGTFTWIGLGLLMVFVLRSQQKRMVYRLADNDNLQQPARWQTWIQLLTEAGRPSLVLALLAVFLQAADSAVSPVQFLTTAGMAIIPAAILAPVLQLLVAERAARRILRIRQQNPAPHKPRTRFIASRAVTAGYRRFAA